MTTGTPGRSWLTRFRMPSWKARAIERIEGVAGAVRRLRTRIEAVRGRDQSNMPREQWVSAEEFNSLRSNGAALVDDLFGTDSEERLRWDRLWTTEPAGSAFGRFPEDTYLDQLAPMLAFLEGLKDHPRLARNPLERAHDALARRPVVGTLVAAGAAIGAIVAFLRAVEWILARIPG